MVQNLMAVAREYIAVIEFFSSRAISIQMPHQHEDQRINSILQVIHFTL